MKARPKVAEVVVRLWREAADWDGLMPSRAQAENIVVDSEESTSDSMERCGSKILIIP